LNLDGSWQLSRFVEVEVKSWRANWTDLLQHSFLSVRLERIELTGSLSPTGRQHRSGLN
jgi:hypothetical protein